MKNLKVIFFGTPDFVIPVIKSLQENFNLVGIVTAPDQKIGRHQILTKTPVADFAEKNNIPVIKPDSLDQKLITHHSSLITADLFIVAAYGKLIPKEILEVPKFGAINIHPSLLPKYRGATPIQSAILNGDEVSGITIIKMDEELDHGPIVYQENFPLINNGTFESLSRKMFQRSAEILPEVILDYSQGILDPVSQNHAIATFCDKVIKQSGYFDINNPPSYEKLDRMIRAYHPWPNAWTKWNGKIVKFLPNCHPKRSAGYKSGISIPSLYSSQPMADQNDKGKYLIQMEGKRPVPLKDFLNGYPNFPLKNL